ncbi:unnamed protein product [Rhodiola kirilowii]
MGTLRKLIYCCLCIEEEEESEDLLSSDFHARSQLSVPMPLSAISSGKTTRSNDGPYDSYLSAEKKKATVLFSNTPVKTVLSADSSASKEKLIDPKKQPSVHFLDTSTKMVLSAESSASKEKLICPKKQASVQISADTSVKKDLSADSSASKEKIIYPKKQEASVHLSDTTIKVLSGDSSASKEKRVYPQKQEASVHLSDATIKNDISRDSSASKEKLIYPQKEITKPDSVLIESKKIASESHDALSISSCNNKNKHLTVEQSTSSHSDSLRRNSIEQLDDNTLSRYLANWEIFMTAAAAHLEYLEEHEPRYTHESMERLSGPHDKVGTSSKAVEKKIQDYCSSQKILLVGEGDFSFSACLAKAFGSAENIVATSLNSEAYLRRHYRNAMNNISQLRMRGCKVFHGVDATDVKNHKMIKGFRFDQIIYNFPHAGHFSSTEIDQRANQLLVRLFMENCVKLIEEKGEIHIRHKSTRFFRQWNLEGLASEAGLVLIEEAPFDIRGFRGYNTKYGFEGAQFRSDYNFDCHSSCTYKFVLSEWQKKLRRQNSKLSAYDTLLIMRS